MSFSDLLTPEGCDPALSRGLAVRLAGSASRRGLSPEVLREVLEACGLVVPAVAVAPANRSPLGRSRGSEGQPRPVPDEGKGEVLCRCPGRKHLLTPVSSESTYVDQRGQRQCRVGIERRRLAGFADDGVLGPGERWCGCEGTKHILTPESSETTYVQASNGHRRCRVGRRNAQLAARKRSAA